MSTDVTGESSQDRATEPFRAEHRDLRRHLGHVASMVGTIGDAGENAGGLMATIVRFFEEHIRPHAKWEEAVLYPLVDEKAESAADHPFTESMRFEHRVVERWMDDLAQISQQSTPDLKAFARRADNLLGLITAHFEEEEDVLLPILDRAMRPEEFAALLRAPHEPA